MSDEKVPNITRIHFDK